jgi:hypothetical protein
VVGPAGEHQPPAAVRPDPLGHSDGGVQRGQRAALLDVQLDEGAEASQQVVAGADQAGVQAGLRHRLGQGDSGVVGQSPGRVRADGAGDQAAAEAGDAEPGAFFFCPGHESHSPFGRKAFDLRFSTAASPATTPSAPS